MKIIALLSLENSIILAYSLIGFISLIAYYPQVRALFKSKGSSQDVSMKTWSIWSVDAAVSLLYASIVLQDLIATLIFGVDFLGAMLILGLTARNRMRAGEFSLHSFRIAETIKFLSK